MLCSGDDSQTRTLSPAVTVLWDTEMQALMTIITRQSRGIPWVAATKTGAPDVEMGIRYVYKLLSGRSWYSDAWQRESMKITPALHGPWRGSQSALSCVFN